MRRLTTRIAAVDNVDDLQGRKVCLQVQVRWHTHPETLEVTNFVKRLRRFASR